MLTIKIDTENDCFVSNFMPEVKDVLNEIINKLQMGKSEGKILDGNGNTVGEFKLGVEK